MEVDTSDITDNNSDDIPKVKKNNDYTNGCIIAILLVILIIIIGLYFTYSQADLGQIGDQIGGQIGGKERMSNRFRTKKLKSSLKRNTITYPSKHVRFDLRKNTTRKFNKNDKTNIFV